jgi:hypothetical protein
MRINRNKMDEKIKKKDKDFYIGIGLCLGVAFGAAFGVAIQQLKKSSK